MSRPWIIAGSLFALLVLVSAAIGAYILMRYRGYSMPSRSMEPTIPMGTKIFVDRFAYGGAGPQRGDLIVFVPPIPSTAPFVKRVVALPGDRFAVHGGRALLNGKPLDEPYVKEKMNYEVAIRDYGIVWDGKPLEADRAAIPPRDDWTSPDTVPRGCYFVLGDNRNDSEDSHVFGFVCPGAPNRPNPSKPAELIGRVLVKAG